MDGIIYPDSEMEVGAPAPDFSGAPAVVGGEITTMSLSQFQGKHVVLLWYPKDFTFVCPTEIIAFNDRAADFAALGAQVIAASTDTPEVHLAWIKTPRARGGLGHMDIPMLVRRSLTLLELHCLAPGCRWAVAVNLKGTCAPQTLPSSAG